MTSKEIDAQRAARHDTSDHGITVQIIAHEDPQTGAPVSYPFGETIRLSKSVGKSLIARGIAQPAS